MNVSLFPSIPNRRAAISDGFVLMIAILVYALVFLIFYFIFSYVALSVEDELQGKQLQIDQDFILNQYLKMPIPAAASFSGENASLEQNKPILVADLITDTVSSRSSEDLERLRNATKIIMQPYRAQYWRIAVYRTADPRNDPDGVTRIFTIANDDVWGPFSLGISSVVQIPHPDQNKFPELSISLLIADLADLGVAS